MSLDEICRLSEQDLSVFVELMLLLRHGKHCSLGSQIPKNWTEMWLMLIRQSFYYPTLRLLKISCISLLFLVLLLLLLLLLLGH